MIPGVVFCVFFSIPQTEDTVLPFGPVYTFAHSGRVSKLNSCEQKLSSHKQFFVYGYTSFPFLVCDFLRMKEICVDSFIFFIQYITLLHKKVGAEFHISCLT